MEEVDTDDAVALVLSLNLVRRHLTSAQRAFVALEVKRRYEAEARRRQRAGGGSVRQKVAEPLRADEAAAKACRTNRAYMQHAQRLTDEAPDLAAQVRAGAADLKDAVGELKRRERQVAARAGARRFDRADEQATLLRGDFREVGAAIPDNSVSLIFTDPPYDRASLPLYSDLGAFAARVLRPGGSLITYVGNLGLLDAGNRLSEHLTYWWTCAVGPLRLRQRVVARRLFSGWKALLWLVKDRGPKTPSWVRDMIQSERDKAHHAWGQGETEARYYIEHLTTTNELVVDPFCGGGTTAAAALALKRRAWTCDVDARAVSAARARLGL